MYAGLNLESTGKEEEGKDQKLHGVGTLRQKMQRSGRSWRELEKTAQSRVRWRIVVDVLMLLMGLSKQVSKLVIFSSLLPKHDN